MKLKRAVEHTDKSDLIRMIDYAARFEKQTGLSASRISDPVQCPESASKPLWRIKAAYWASYIVRSAACLLAGHNLKEEGSSYDDSVTVICARCGYTHGTYAGTIKDSTGPNDGYASDDRWGPEAGHDCNPENVV